MCTILFLICTAAFWARLLLLSALVFSSFFCNLPYFKTFSRYMNLTRCQTSTVIYACCVTSVSSKCCYRDCRGQQYIFQRTKLSVKLCIKNSKRSKKEAVAKKEAGEQRNSCFFLLLGLHVSVEGYNYLSLSSFPGKTKFDSNLRTKSNPNFVYTFNTTFALKH